MKIIKKEQMKVTISMINKAAGEEVVFGKGYKNLTPAKYDIQKKLICLYELSPSGSAIGIMKLVRKNGLDNDNSFLSNLSYVTINKILKGHIKPSNKNLEVFTIAIKYLTDQSIEIINAGKSATKDLLKAAKA